MACRLCGRVREVPCAVGAAPCLEPLQDEDFAVDEAQVTRWGTCRDCRDQERRDQPQAN
jgi:Fur family ferric uptake transcriptional regulator